MENDIASIRARLKKPIVMVGLMGAGKTKIGALLAAALDLPFVDADQEIEKSAQCSIADIFQQYGEPAFRDLERKIIQRLMSEELKVIATGGGAVMQAETGELVWSRSTSIWLKADLDILVERTGRSGKRPLLSQGDPKDILRDLMEKRYPVYGRADIVVQTDAGDADVMLARVVSALDEYLQKA